MTIAMLVFCIIGFLGGLVWMPTARKIIGLYRSESASKFYLVLLGATATCFVPCLLALILMFDGRFRVETTVALFVGGLVWSQFGNQKQS